MTWRARARGLCPSRATFRRQGNQRQDINRQAATQAFLDGKRVVGEDVAERQRLDQFAMLRGRQGGIVHVTSVGPGSVGEACGGAWAMVPAWIWVSGGIAALGA